MDEDFEGRIGRYHWDSEPWWPEARRPPAGAPNVLVVLLDDVGFAQLGCYGSDIDTPNMDRLAAGGLQYTNFHTTALCSPTRSCVLTGRNHHANGIGRVIELAMGFPGYDMRIPRANGMLPEMLVPEGYAAWAIGKWHLTPEEESNLGARRDRWPLGRGFERYYGFFGGEAHQFAPVLVYDNHHVDPPQTYEEGYHLTEDLADRGIEFIRDLRAVDPDKPFFLYFCPGACHSPHQAPPEWIERYRGHFDQGWDQWRQEVFTRQLERGLLPEGTELSPRPDWIPAWDSVSDDERRLYARYMEAFAGFLSHTDAQLGRLVDELEARGDLDNTLILLASDNGASSEGGVVGSLNDARTWNAVPHDVIEAVERIDEIGGPTIHNNYPWGWTMAGNTPFRRWKRETHEGGVADPLIVHWPAGIPADEQGGLRRQYVHATDLAPTILEAAGLEAPEEIGGIEQRPLDGVSFGYSFADPDAPTRHLTQYYEMFGCRGIYHDGWKAVMYHQIQFDEPGLDQVAWELYDVVEDPSECKDLAAEHPDKVEELAALWWSEAERNQVLPVDNRPFSDYVRDRPDFLPERTRYEYWRDQPPVPESAAADVKDRTHVVTAEIVVGEEIPEGVLVHQGDILGGWALYVAEGELVYVHNRSGRHEDRIAAAIDLGPGPHQLGFRFTKGEGWSGDGALIVDGEEVAAGHLRQFTWNRFSLVDAGLTVGYAAGIPVTQAFTGPFRWAGALERVLIDVEGERQVDPMAEVQTILDTQ